MGKLNKLHSKLINIATIILTCMVLFGAGVNKVSAAAFSKMTNQYFPQALQTTSNNYDIPLTGGTIGMVKWSLYLPKEMIEKIAAYSNSMGYSSSDMVRLAIKDYLKRHKV